MQEHYFSEKPRSSDEIFKIESKLLGKKYIFFSSNSVFSKKKVDKNTRILIENCVVREKTKVLDLGCGYGAVGIVLKDNYDIDVTCSDINERALFLTKKNTEINNVAIKVVKSDLFSNLNENFDNIICNPAFHVGRKFVLKLIEESFLHLNKKGIFQMVATHNRGGSYYKEKMKQIFGNVRDIVKKGGVRVYLSEKL